MLSSVPLTPRFRSRVSGPSSWASRGTQPSRGGSVAPTPTVSDAPIATYTSGPPRGRADATNGAADGEGNR